MNLYSRGGGAHDHRCFPERGADEPSLLSFRDRIINPWSAYRNSHLADVALWISYYLGRQWLDRDVEGSFGGVRGALLRDSTHDMPIDMPRPVTNEVDPAVEQTVISLVQRKWTASAKQNSSDPAMKAAAQVATDLTQFRLDTLDWPTKRHEHACYFTVGGTGLIYTGVDNSYAKLRTIGAPTAVWCASCSNKFYSSDIPADTMRAGINGRPLAFAETAKPVPAEEFTPELFGDAAMLDLQRLNYCPICDSQANPLQPYTPTKNEALSFVDPFGRSLGIDEPCHSAALEIDLPFEFYPDSNGYRQSPYSLRRFGRRKIRSMEWLEERAPHLFDEYDIEPDSVAELLQNDPIVGSWDALSGWSAQLDVGILDYHKNVDEVVELPSIKHPLGRYLLAIKDKVIEDGDLLIPSANGEVDEITGEPFYVARAAMSISRFKLRPTEIWGTGLPQIIISPQNRLNTLDGQLINWRLTQGNPTVYMPADMWVDDPIRVDDRYLNKFVFFQQSVSMPEVTQPIIGGNQLMNAEVYEERDRIQADIKRRAGPQDASIGAAPKSGTPSVSLQLQIDQDLRSQSLREEELIRSFERSATHLMRMEWLLQTDKIEYRVLGPNKVWSYHQYEAHALRGQIEIEVERGSSISHSSVNREAAREALADQLIDTSSILVRRELLELYGLDPNLSPEISFQVDHAERVWVNFRDKGLIAVQDTIDNPVIHYLVLSKFLRTEEGEQLATAANWDDFLRRVAGWQDELIRLELLDQQTIAFYGGRLYGDAAKEAYGNALVKWNQKMELYEQQLQNRSVIAQDPIAGPAAAATVPPAERPMKPPPPIFLPVLLQDRVMLIWQQMLQNGAPPPPPSQDQPLDNALLPIPPIAKKQPQTYIPFRALVEAYRLSASGGSAAASAGMGPAQPQPSPSPSPSPQQQALPPGAPAEGSAPAPAPDQPAPMPEGGA